MEPTSERSPADDEPADVTRGVAVVTGGASGIGLALVHELRSRGARVVVGDVEDKALEAVAPSEEVLRVRCDVRHRRSHEQLRDAALEAYGRVDLVCLNAGVAPTGPVADTSEATWRWLFEVNVLGVAHGVSVFAPVLAEHRGHLLITASVAGLVASPGLGAYSASKHAVIGLANTLRGELEPEGVGLTVLCPGFVVTNVFSSERNRPEDLDGESHVDPAVMEFVIAMADETGLTAEEVAVAALAGVHAGESFVLPNAELDPVVSARDDLLRAAMRR